jgi:hypothetical protein
MYRYFIISFILLLNTIVKSQDVELGFRIESLGLYKSYSNFKTANFTYNPFPSCFQLTLALYPVKRISIEGRFGGEFFYDDYSGAEYGIFVKYFISSPIYLTGGVAGHSNDGGSGSNYDHSFTTSIIMPAIGFGIKPFNHVGIEALFQLANKKEIASHLYFTGSDAISYKQKVDWLVKLGFAFGWNL